MKRLTKNQNKEITKENIHTYFKSQTLLQEEKKKGDLSFDVKETDYDLGHIYGSW